MEQNNFYTRLSIPDVWDEIQQSDIEKVNSLPGKHPFIDATNFSIPDTVIKLSNILDLTINPSCSFLFHCKPAVSGPIHIDGDRTYHRLSAINWVWNGEESLLNWYSVMGEQKTRFYQNKEIPYFDQESTRKIYSSVICGCALINVSMPHNVDNFSEKNRYTLSIGFMENFSYLSMLAILKEKGLLIL
jgi:hypothetical protein